MKRLLLPFLLGSSLALGGCAAGIAASALGMAVRSAQGTPESNAHMAPAAVEACTARASQFGIPSIIDVEQRSLSKIVVWGKVENGGERRSFECAFETKITSFKLREINASR